MADLVLGPLLRYVGETEATVWVETDSPCEVEILGRERADLRGRGAPLRAGPDRGPRAGLVQRVRGRARRRDAAGRCPTPTCRRARSARSAATKPVDICFGSCRVALPHDRALRGRRRTRHQAGKEYDALRVLAIEMLRETTTSGRSSSSCSATRSTSTRARRRPASRSASAAAPTTPPGEEVTDFEEYSWLYQESWSDPMIRWLLLDGLDLDGLGRPRHERRLEHLPLLARGDAASAPGGTAARTRG